MVTKEVAYHVLYIMSIELCYEVVVQDDGTDNLVRKSPEVPVQHFVKCVYEANFIMNTS